VLGLEGRRIAETTAEKACTGALVGHSDRYVSIRSVCETTIIAGDNG
jgi:hypothetical protein